MGDGARDGIEIGGVFEAAACFIVIAANGDGIERADFVDDFIGIGAVADHVAETNGAIPFAFDGRERGLEAGHVGVNVTENQISHCTWLVGCRVAHYRRHAAQMHSRCIPVHISRRVGDVAALRI